MEQDIFNFIIDIRQQQFEQIKKEWGFSTVKLKEYLKGEPNYKFVYGYAEDLCEIKVNRLLPYTNNKRYMFYGSYAIERLQLAIEAKAIIMLLLGDLEGNAGQIAFINECLHLFLRIDSTRTLELTYKAFCEMVNKVYYKVLNTYNNTQDWEALIQDIVDKCEYYKSKKDQVKYHYTFEDFELVRNCQSWNEAYEMWINNVYPYLLDNYKNKLMDEYKQELAIKAYNGTKISSEQYQELISKKQAKLDKIKITKLTRKSFEVTINRMKKQMEQYKK